MIKHPSRQAGSALIVSLAFLLILTVLGVSAMNTTRLQLRMSVNQQAATKTSLAATSALNKSIADTDFRQSAIPNDTFYFNEDTAGLYANAGKKYLEKVDTTTQTILQAAALVDGFSVGSMSAFHIEVNATAQGVAGAEAIQIQGLYLIGPADDVASKKGTSL